MLETARWYPIGASAGAELRVELQASRTYELHGVMLFVRGMEKGHVGFRNFTIGAENMMRIPNVVLAYDTFENVHPQRVLGGNLVAFEFVRMVEGDPAELACLLQTDRGLVYDLEVTR
jgi:hypothetical protein